MLVAEDIKNIYKAMLGRQPENDAIIDRYLNNHKTIDTIISQVQKSEEYKKIYCLANIPKTVLVYIHIPKTAGTYLRTAWLKKNVKNYYWSDEKRSSPLVKDFKESYIVASSYEMIGGHLPLSTFLEFQTLQPRYFLNVLREPVSRIISFYNHIKNNDTNHPLHEEANSHTLYELLSEKGVFYKMILNEQVRYLIASGESLKNFSDRDLLIVGRQDNIGDFVETVNKVAGLECGCEESESVEANTGAENYEIEIKKQKDFSKALTILRKITKTEKRLFQQLSTIKVMNKEQYLMFIKSFS